MQDVNIKNIGLILHNTSVKNRIKDRQARGHGDRLWWEDEKSEEGEAALSAFFLALSLALLGFFQTPLLEKRSQIELPTYLKLSRTPRPAPDLAQRFWEERNLK